MRILASVFCNLVTKRAHFRVIPRRIDLITVFQRRYIHSSVCLARQAADVHDHGHASDREFLSDVTSRDKVNDSWKLHRRIVTTTSMPWPPRRNKIMSFDVGYIDTGAEWSTEKKEETPTIVAIHGTPATHKDVIPMIVPFHDKGYRAIAVNLPGYDFSTGVTKKDYDTFSQSTPRIAEFLLDFLVSVDVKEVSILVGHSGGSLPCTVLAVLSDMVKSVMFICPPSGHTRTPSMEPMWAVRMLVKAYKYQLGRMILRPLLPIINRMTIKLQSDRPSHIMSTVRYVSNIDYALLRQVATILNTKKLPMLYVCSENDKLVLFKFSMDWAEKLGISREQFDEYDTDFKIHKEAEYVETEYGYRKGVSFARGGHFPQLKPDTTLPILISEAEKLVHIANSENSPLKTQESC